MLHNVIAPEKAREAAFALAVGWETPAITEDDNSRLSQMRKAALDAISFFGIANDSVFINLEKSFFNNLSSNTPDYEEIRKTLNALTELNTDKTVNLMYKFLNELHNKRSNPAWGNKESRIYQWVINSLMITGVRYKKIAILLHNILRTEIYTMQERVIAKNALIEIRNKLLAEKSESLQKLT